MDGPFPGGVRGRLDRPDLRPPEQPAEQQHRQPNEQHHLLSAHGGLCHLPALGRICGGSFTHFSNGAFQMPNLGINIPAVSASLRYTPQPVEKEGYVRWEESKRPPGRFGVQGYFSLAYKETSFPGAAKWPVYAGSLAGIYRISKVQNLLIGGEYEYYQSVFVFSRHTFSAASSEQARREATRRGVFLATEWQFGNTGLLVQLGYYVNPNNYPTPFPVYNKLGLRYYLRPIVRSGVQFYGGVYLKSHIITADYISIGIGIRFLQFS
ncbi:MAG: hypothetical protein IPG32_01395 [Saprospirales bacterium]|nr:hypothetical protein [Saprospirales bacterium]